MECPPAARVRTLPLCAGVPGHARRSAALLGGSAPKARLAKRRTDEERIKKPACTLWGAAGFWWLRLCVLQQLLGESHFHAFTIAVVEGVEARIRHVARR